MSTNIVPFNFNDHQVRVVTIDGEPWFVLADLCRVLGIGNPSEVTRRIRESLGDDALSLTEVIDSLGRKQSATTVSEAGMYEVVIRSDKPEAAAFRRWITGTVLPEIRKTGGYGVQRELTEQEIVFQALTILKTKNEELEQKVAEDAPKVEYVDTFVARDDCRTFGDLAKSLGLAESYIREELLKRKWIYRKFIGERFSAKKGRKVEEWEYRNSADHKAKFRLFPQHNAPRHHNNQYRQTLYVTPYGAQQIARLLGVANVSDGKPVLRAVEGVA